jgi:AcrR family transcriptional regulator
VSEKSSRLGRPPRYTLDEVLDAAERMPFERLTMTALAQELGLVTSALYRYVRDRSDLLAHLRARLGTLLPIPDEALEWDAWITQVSLGIYDLVLAHPVISDVRSWVAFFPTEGRAMLDARDRVLARSGLRAVDANVLYTAATNLALAYATSRIGVRAAPEIEAAAGGPEETDRTFRATLTDGVALLLDGARRRLEEPR